MVFTGFQNSSLESGAMTVVFISWTPEVAGDYTVEIFVWDKPQPPAQPLSTVAAMNIRVTG